MAKASGTPDPIEVTVTFLEMETPPGHYPALPYNRNVALLRAKDIPMHYYRYLMDRIGGKWQWVNALRLGDRELAARLADPEREIVVLHVDGAPAGLYEIAPHEEGTVELVYFGLMEQVTGQGIGKWFLGAAIHAAWDRKPAAVRVQTCTLDHPAALPLYQRLGFVPVGQVRDRVQPMTLDERAEVLVRP